MTQQQEYEDRIKAIVKEAMAEGIVWTGKQFGQIADAAMRERSAEAMRAHFEREDT